jgi:hypothetical protein
MTDWRVDNVTGMEALRFRRKHYTRRSEAWDHEHCTACYAKFAEVDEPDIQHEGYATCEDWKHGPDYDWICLSCFADLRDAMGWG